MRTRFLISLVVIAVVLIMVVPATAITDGEPDGDGHPYVGLMVAQDAAGDAQQEEIDDQGGVRIQLRHQ